MFKSMNVEAEQFYRPRFIVRSLLVTCVFCTCRLANYQTFCIGASRFNISVSVWVITRKLWQCNMSRVIRSQRVSSKYRSEWVKCVPKMHCDPVTLAMFGGGLGRIWPHSFGSVYKNVSWAMLKDRLLNWCPKVGILTLSRARASYLTTTGCIVLISLPPSPNFQQIRYGKCNAASHKLKTPPHLVKQKWCICVFTYK